MTMVRGSSLLAEAVPASRPASAQISQPARKAEGLARAIAAQRALENRCATHLEEFGCGMAVINAELPGARSLNFVRAERDLDGLEPRGLIWVAEAQLGNAGLGHRRVVIDAPRAAAPLVEKFRSEGWSSRRLSVMAQRGPIEPRATPHPAREIAQQQVESTREAALRRQAGGELHAMDDELSAAHAKCAALPSRFFGTLVHGAVAAYCVLRSHDGTGLIDEFTVLDHFPGTAAGPATLAMAVQASRAAGNVMTFMLGPDDPWQQGTFRRFGFTEIGSRWELDAPAA
jgi:hypothetical protein